MGSKTGRDSLKIQDKFRDWLKYDIIKKNFPVKAMNVLAVLATRIWVRRFLNASPTEKLQMIQELIREREAAEQDGHLHNSRQIEEIGEEDES